MTINPASPRELCAELDLARASAIGRLRRRFVGHALILPLALLLLSSAGAARASHLALGINYTWFRLGASTADCRTHPASVLWQSAILPQYQDPAVRTPVQAQLRSMHQSGFTTIRTFVNLRWRTQKSKNEGPLASKTGVLSPEDKSSLAAFMDDIAGAGFTSVEISFGGVGIYCRKHEWGDCFDPAQTAREWVFTEDAAKTAIAAAGNHLNLRFDLGNEGCPAPSMPTKTKQNAATHFVEIATKFEAEFGDNWLISCGNSPGDQRQRLMLKILKAAGLSPKYLEVHSYSTEPKGFSDVLTAANAMAESVSATLILGESRYHSDQQAAMLQTWLRQTPNSRLAEVIQWPLSEPSTKCPIDTSPPYSPGPLRDLAK